jgi:hypothetical protein
MYPSLTEGAQGAPESRPEPQDAVAARMYPSVADPAPERREATPERRMYPSMQQDAGGQQRTTHSDQQTSPTDPGEYADLDLWEGAVDTLTELGINRSGAERLVELELQHATQYWDNQISSWQDEIMSSPDADEMVQDALAMVQAYGDEDLPSQLGPYGNHPGLIRMLSRIRRQLQHR